MCMILRAANCQTWAEPVAIIFGQRILGGNDAGTRQRATCLSHLCTWGQSLDYYDPDFFFIHSSNPKLTCYTLDTFVQMSSLLHKRQEDPRQPGGQELWKQDLMTRTSSASWIILHELTCFHLRCGKAGSLFVIERLGLALACAEVVLKDNNRSYEGKWK